MPYRKLSTRKFEKALLDMGEFWKHPDDEPNPELREMRREEYERFREYGPPKAYFDVEDQRGYLFHEWYAHSKNVRPTAGKTMADGIVKDGEGVLLLGFGKTATSAVACIREGCSLVGADYMLIYDAGGGAPHMTAATHRGVAGALTRGIDDLSERTNNLSPIDQQYMAEMLGPGNASPEDQQYMAEALGIVPKRPLASSDLFVLTRNPEAYTVAAPVRHAVMMLGERDPEHHDETMAVEPATFLRHMRKDSRYQNDRMGEVMECLLPWLDSTFVSGYYRYFPWKVADIVDATIRGRGSQPRIPSLFNRPR